MNSKLIDTSVLAAGAHMKGDENLNALTAIRLAMNELLHAYTEVQKDKVKGEELCIEAQKLINKAIADMRKTGGKDI